MSNEAAGGAEAILVANLMAVLPARRAAAIRPAEVLRAERPEGVRHRPRPTGWLRRWVKTALGRPCTHERDGRTSTLVARSASRPNEHMPRKGGSHEERV